MTCTIFTLKKPIPITWMITVNRINGTLQAQLLFHIDAPRNVLMAVAMMTEAQYASACSSF